jgi:hypothetical protein
VCVCVACFVTEFLHLVPVELKSRLDASEAAKSNLRSKLNATEQKLRELKMYVA